MVDLQLSYEKLGPKNGGKKKSNQTLKNPSLKPSHGDHLLISSLN